MLIIDNPIFENLVTFKNIERDSDVNEFLTIFRSSFIIKFNGIQCLKSFFLHATVINQLMNHLIPNAIFIIG